VNYIGKAASLYDAGYELNGSAYVISKFIGNTWLWDRVRVSGGAYGGFCDFDSHSGVFSYLSYRDPNLVKTLDNYDGTVQFLRDLQLDDDALTKAIIGTIGDVDAYQLPDAKGYTRCVFSFHVIDHM
jgi:Zn-dependent M16 (insulinase) family peptidase